MKFRGRLLAIFALALSASLQSDEPIELADDLVHSDVPLWGVEHKDIWPQHFTTEEPEYSFGCSSRVRFGDWQVTSSQQGGSDRWIQLSNYGVFHCALIEQRAYDREDLAKAPFEYGFAVKIGETQQEGRKLELWVLQSGTRTGSKYTLLAREPSDGLVDQFIILQRRCPAGKMRKGPNLDVWSTDYCAINSQAEMIELARRMAQLPPLATMKWVGDAEKTAETEEN